MSSLIVLLKPKLSPNFQKRLSAGFRIVSIILFIGLIFGFLLKGSYSRYLQDDYCYGAEVVRLGFWPVQLHSYFSPMPYNSNRYALTLFSGIAEVLGGPRFSPFITALAIFSWIAGLFYTAFQWHKANHLPKDIWAVWISSFIILFFSFLLAPSQYQVLYWRSAILPYLTPVVLNTFLLGLCFDLSYRKTLHWQIGLVLLLLSLLAGGFSETAALWQFALFSILLVFSIVRKPPWKEFLKPILWVLGGSLLAVLLLGFCPANAQRIQSLQLQQSDLYNLVTKTLRYGYTYIRYAVRIKLLDFIVIAVTGFWLGWRVRGGFRSSPIRIILMALFTGISCYFLVVAVTLPTMYIMSSPPDGRGLFPAQVSIIATVFLMGWLSAQFLTSVKPSWNQNPIVNGTILSLTILSFIFLAAYLPGVYDGMPAYRSRAHYWDLRHEMILNAVSIGEQDLQVPEFNSISQVAEFRQEADFWVNVCAARYYQVHTISAIEGYRGFPVDFN